jgi:ATP-dependent DNA helicase RecG
MVRDAELLEMLADIESDRVERKASLSDPDRIRQVICAFANDLPDHRKPGVLFIGANDDGSCANIPITDELLRTLADMRSDGRTLPFPVMTVQKRVLNGNAFAVVVVEPSDNPPLRYDGRVWIRVGPRRATATAEEERRLYEKRRSADLPFDQQPVSGASLADLDLDLFKRVYLPAAIARDVLDGNNRSLEQQLASLHFLTPTGIPNIASLLVFGKDPVSLIRGAYIQFVRFVGQEITNPIQHQKELSGPFPQILRQIDEIFDANISIASDVCAGAVEIQHPDYPIIALQQLIRNAVLHRTYEATHAPVKVYWFSDRIEIYSPGGLYGQVNPENFGQPNVTDYRNPLLAEAMKSLGFVQRFGMGIPLARKALADNDNPPLDLVPSPNAVLATVWRRP